MLRCYARKANLLKPSGGISGLCPSCIATPAGFLFGDSVMREIKVREGKYAVVFNCDYCKKEHRTNRSHYWRRQRHFCSTECYTDFQRWCLPKEEHSRYGCGHTLAERLIRKNSRSALNHAIQQGKIKREPCKICGKAAEAHHPDYTKPLLVEWLCFPHHREFHNLQRLVYTAEKGASGE
ncbi:hypothetical protein LCGC14_1225600 [marine sediment metagenome]|uniref:TRASH domain-containing protein n=1 Tax=marine sediment metagenome TaxID=412755 RepID=A0A0F9PED3_9ZZZZ